MDGYTATGAVLAAGAEATKRSSSRRKGKRKVDVLWNAPGALKAFSYLRLCAGVGFLCKSL